MIIFAIVFPIFLGFLFYARKKENINLVNIFSIIFIGFGLNSIFFVCLKFLRLDLRLLIIIESLMSVLFTYILFFYHKNPSLKIIYRNIFNKISPTSGVIIVFFGISILLNFISILNYSFSIPHGGIDAWAIWNLKAKFLFFGDGTNFIKMFSSKIAWSHPDYPLFLPATIAHFWTFSGDAGVLIPMLIGIIISFFSIFLLFFAVYKKYNYFLGLIAGLILLGTPSFLIHGASQFADNLLGFALLLIFVETSDFWKNFSNISAWRLGLIVSLIAWIKNEGLLIFLIFSSVILLTLIFKKRKKEIIFYFLGALPIISFIILYKFIGNLNNDVINLKSINGFQIDSVNKIEIIFREFSSHLSEFRGIASGDLLLTIIIISLPVVLLASKLRKDLILVNFFCFFSILLCYLSIYLITPLNMIEHINTSLNRLLLQLLPSFLYLFFSAFYNIQFFLAKSKFRKRRNID